MKTLSAAVATAIYLAAPAFAGGYAEPTPSPVIVPEAAPATDWSGAYVGLTYGTADTTTSFGFTTTDLELDAEHLGVFGGYLHDMGDIVVGAQLMYEHVDVDSFVIDDASRIGASLLAGYDLGRVLPYAHIGLAWFDTGTLDTTENGVSFGIGAMVAVTDNIRLSADFSRTVYDDYLDAIPGGNELEADTLRLGVAFQF